MQLKKIQLLGFKTFADKTEIELDTGLTAVVGPNGSGKSNLVDALLWVLGEQNPRLLRGHSAQDVIFAGTDRRKPLGLAEVRLTIDNSDRSLPIEFTEVTITRRVYRSGESQYLINNAPCRLKDIVELFLDTGVGKGAYAFVSQNEIDAVLSARPEDRRELFEEAAGIKKYRVKKKEALRKLEAAEANLTRVRDILRELEAQREPMERQAMTARRYLLLQERLREIEVGLLVAELQKADYELYAGRQAREDDQARLLQHDAELARLERASEGVGERLAQAESELDAARLAQQHALSQVERAESRLALLNEREQTAQRTQAQLGEELRDIAARQERLAQDIQRDQEDLTTTEQEETARDTEWAAQKAALAELEAAYREAVREVEARQSERMRRAQARAAQEAALAATRDRLAEAQTRAERLAQELAALETALSEAADREARAQKAHADGLARQEQLAEARAQLEACQKTTQAELAAARSALDTARRQQAEQAARLATLTELQENHEGFYQGVRAVLSAAKKGQISGHYRAVVDLLTVPEPYRVAIEVALGGSLQDIVTRTEAEAKTGIEWLKRNRAGRATFLPLPLLRPGSKLAVRDSWSAVSNGMDVVTFAPEYAAVAQLLLGRVLVVADMDTAIAVSRQIQGWSKIVTLEGELLTPGGALTGGSLQGRGAHLIGRKGEMDDLKARLPQTQAEVARRMEAVETHTRALQALEMEREAGRRREAELISELTAAESARAAAQRERERLTRERSERRAAQGNLLQQITDWQTEETRLRTLLETSQAETLSADDALTALSEQAHALAERRDACRAQAIALEVETSRLRERREGLARAIGVNQAALEALEQQQAQKSAQKDATLIEVADAALERERLGRELTEARQRLERIETELTQWRDRRQALLAENFEMNNALKETGQRRAAVTQNLHATELALARLEVQVAQVTERLQEEYGISREEALARPEDVTIDKTTAMEVARLRRELRGMGQVNTGAVEEYERLTERATFLTTQRDDLETGRESLLATIAEIDQSTRGVFLETFEAVRAEFNQLFTRLFEGGSTKLILTNPDDLLETGIEVIAQPPGKKPQSLSLLSGGERALTATALLFAFLAVKPSPFVLLDEVDAPLDGANVEKFSRLVLEFSRRSQFLLITHNPTTMEAAPTWYGVTMREPGISSVLSYRVPQDSIAVETEQAVVLDAHSPTASLSGVQ